MKINRFVWASNEKPREVLSANDEINDYLLYVEEMGCGIRDAGARVCEDFGCKSILDVIELMSKEAQ